MTPTIWKKTYEIDALNELCANTIHSALGIRFTEIGPDFLRGEMPVDERTRQPFGVLHGGASVVLAESLGSMAAFLVTEEGEKGALGIEVNANHLKAVRHGVVVGTARPEHIGNTIQVWRIEVRDQLGDLVCTSRLTVLARRSASRPQA